MISVAIIGSVCSETVMRDMTLPRRIIICIYRCRYRALSSKFRCMDVENSNEKEEEEHSTCTEALDQSEDFGPLRRASSLTPLLY